MRLFAILCLLSSFAAHPFGTAYGQEPEIYFRYLGHSSFLITFDNNVSVLTDYGKPNAWKELGWDSPIKSIGNFKPDIVTYSHEHEDHYDETRIDVKALVVYKGGPDFEVKDLHISTIGSSEKDIRIKDNNSYLFEYNGVKILHLGDCQANILNIDDPSNKKFLLEHMPENCDVILMPIEGTQKFIPQAVKFIDLIRARVTIPMHYWSREYKESFFEYLTKNSLGSKTAFEIIRLRKPDFIYRKTNHEQSLRIIDLQPE